MKPWSSSVRGEGGTFRTVRDGSFHSRLLRHLSPKVCENRDILELEEFSSENPFIHTSPHFIPEKTQCGLEQDDLHHQELARDPTLVTVLSTGSDISATKTWVLNWPKPITSFSFHYDFQQTNGTLT